MDLGLEGQVVVLDVAPEPLLEATARACLEERAEPVLVDRGDGAVQRARRALASTFGLRCRVLPAPFLMEGTPADWARRAAGSAPLAGVAIAAGCDWAARAGPWWREEAEEACRFDRLSAVLLCGRGSASEGAPKAAVFSLLRAGFRTNVVELAGCPRPDPIPEAEFACAASLVVFLMSSRSAYFNGRVFQADPAALNVL